MKVFDQVSKVIWQQATPLPYRLVGKSHHRWLVSGSMQKNADVRSTHSLRVMGDLYAHIIQGSCGATWVCSQNRILIGSVIFAQFIIATGVSLEGKETKLRDVLQRDLCCFIDHTSMTTSLLGYSNTWVHLHTTTCRTGLTPGWGHVLRCRSCPPPGPVSAQPVNYTIIPNTQTMLCVPL